MNWLTARSLAPGSPAKVCSDTHILQCMLSHCLSVSNIISGRILLKEVQRSAALTVGEGGRTRKHLQLPSLLHKSINQVTTAKAIMVNYHHWLIIGGPTVKRQGHWYSHVSIDNVHQMLFSWSWSCWLSACATASSCFSLPNGIAATTSFSKPAAKCLKKHT